MQILLDTIEDSPEELNLAREIIRLAALRRSKTDVPPGTKLQIVTGVERDTQYSDGTASILEMTRAAGFGKAPLPADAIAIDVPDSFTQPSGTESYVPTSRTADSTVPPAPSFPSPTKRDDGADSATGETPAVPPTGLPAVSSAATSPPVEEDSDGYVWDARIHSSSKKKHADGRWHLKRGVAPELVVKVKAELRAAEVIDTAAANEAIAAPFIRSLVEQAAWVAGAVDDPAVNAKVDAAMLAATSPVVPPPPPAPPAPPAAPAPPMTPATAATLNFTPAQVAALGVHAGPTAQPASTTAVVPAAPAAAGPSEGIAPPVPVNSPASVPAAPSAPPAANGITPAPSATTSLSSFKELMAQVVTPAMQAKKITPTEISTLCKSIGLPNGLPDLLPDTQPPRVELARVADAVRRHVGAA